MVCTVASQLEGPGFGSQTLSNVVFACSFLARLAQIAIHKLHTCVCVCVFTPLGEKNLLHL